MRRGNPCAAFALLIIGAAGLLLVIGFIAIFGPYLCGTLAIGFAFVAIAGSLIKAITG